MRTVSEIVGLLHSEGVGHTPGDSRYVLLNVSKKSEEKCICQISNLIYTL